MTNYFLKIKNSFKTPEVVREACRRLMEDSKVDIDFVIEEIEESPKR